MRVLIRADASQAIGTGHVMRCLALAQWLRESGAEVRFACRKVEGHLGDRLAQSAFDVHFLPGAAGPGPEDAAASLQAFAGPPDWTVVDHYGLDERWEARVRQAGSRLVAIDDWGRRHACDVLVDQTFGEAPARYDGRVPPECLRLVGSEYAMLRPEFARVRQHLSLPALEPQGHLAHVFFGGGETGEAAAPFAASLLERFEHLRLRVAIGAGSRQGGALAALAERFGPRLSWDQGVFDMAAHMEGCTVALGAPGVATWERACLGLPSACLATVDDHEPFLAKLEARGLVRDLGRWGARPVDTVLRAVAAFLEDTRELERMRAAGLTAIDGRGASRIAAAMG